MKAVTGEFAQAMERVEQALAEVHEAQDAYDAWMAAWRARNGHTGPYDVMGFPMTKEAADKARALAGTEGA